MLSITRILLGLIFVFHPIRTLTAAPRVIHVYVALCDNKYQGIVPVGEKIGNGQDPENNLYWGWGYGVRTFFKKDADWNYLGLRMNPASGILQRCIFKHKTNDVWLVADAWDGKEIQNCTREFLEASGGYLEDTVMSGKDTIHIGGCADLLAYVGHNGLMDFTLDPLPEGKTDKKRSVIILACASKSYFTESIRNSKADPILWTTNLMGPEAYTLEAAVDGWIQNESGAMIRQRAGGAYNLYVKCGLKGALNLFATGF